MKKYQKIALGMAMLGFAGLSTGPMINTSFAADNTEISSEKPERPHDRKSPHLAKGEKPSIPSEDCDIQKHPRAPKDFKGEKPSAPPEGFDGKKHPRPPKDFKGEKPSAPPEGFDGKKHPRPPKNFKGEKPPVPPEGFDGEKPPMPPIDFNGENPPAAPEGVDGEMPPMPGGGQQNVDVSSLSANTIVDNDTEKISKVSLDESSTDANTVLVRNGGKLKLTDSKLSKTGDTSNADASNFSGQNAVFLAANSEATIRDVEITSDADGANAIFATGENAKISVENVKIHTKNNSSRGLDSTYGGRIEANNVDITTEGDHCGALATDRGEGFVIVKNAKLNTSGKGSPCIYSTGDIQLTNATGRATGSEIAVVEGKNSITLDNATLTGYVDHGVMLYQSFSGDANVGEAKFSATNSTLRNFSEGPMFFITNTTASATLDNVTLVQGGNTLINANSARWGKEGENGGHFTLNTTNQKMTGDVVANSISTITMNLGADTDYSGAINTENTAQSIILNLSKDSIWNVTADSYITAISDEDTSFENIRSNGHTIYYSADSNPSLNGQTVKLPDGGKLVAK